MKKFRLKDSQSGQYAGLTNRGSIILVEKMFSTLFDENDNEKLKMDFHNAASGRKFEIEVESCAS